MKEPRPVPSILRFGAFELDPRAGELRKHGMKVRLQGQPIEILAMLLECPGEVVTREELQERLWSADTFVDFEQGLNAAIKRLRAALDDEADNPSFIETLPRRGYRFIATVEEIIRPSRLAQAPASVLVGQVSVLRDDGSSPFVLAPVDEDSLREKEKLEAANDDLGLSMLIASRKILLLPSGTKVRVLESRQPHPSYQVRILEGEYVGETALVPRKHLEGV